MENSRRLEILDNREPEMPTKMNIVRTFFSEDDKIENKKLSLDIVFFMEFVNICNIIELEAQQLV